MKKTLAFIAAMLMIAAMLPGCGSKPAEEQGSADSSNSETADSSSDGSSAETTSSDSKEDVPAPVSETAANTPTPVDVTLFDKNDIKIKATEFRINTDADNGHELGLEIENKTGKELTIYILESSINGWVMQVDSLAVGADGNTDFSGVFTVPADKDTNKYSAYVSDSLLQSYGLSEIQDMELAMEIFVGDDPDSTPLYCDRVDIKNPDATGEPPVFDEEGDVAYDKDGIKIVLQGAGYDEEFFGPTVFLYAYNGSDKTIDMRINKSVVNGEEHEAFGDQTIAPGKHMGEAVPFEGLSGAAPISTITLGFELYEYDPLGEGKLIATVEPFTAEYEPLDVEVKALSKEELAKAKGWWSREGAFEDDKGNSLSIDFLTEAQHWSKNEWYAGGNFADGSYWGGSAELTDKGLTIKNAETLLIHDDGTMEDGKPISAEITEDGKDGVKIKFSDGKELTYVPAADTGLELDGDTDTGSKAESKEDKKADSKADEKAESKADEKAESKADEKAESKADEKAGSKANEIAELS